MMRFVLCSGSISNENKRDYMHFVSSVQWHCTILMKTTRLNRTLTGLFGEYMTFDQFIKMHFELELLL